MSKEKSVLLGLSGGVDSSVSAFLLKKQGYKVIGAFLKMYSETKNKLTGECSYLDDLKMARKIASLLNIEIIVLDYENQYKNNVLNSMFKAYKSGLTPNPDISCNTIIKFPFLWKEAKKLGCDYIATGHYARIKKSKSGFSLLAGKDKSKDQSYFLSGIAESDLAHTLFPLGDLKKEKVRQIAKRNIFPNWDKHGTAGICFVGQIPMMQFLKQRIKEKEGKVRTIDGKVIGTHRGIPFYTIGQRAGSHIGINITKPKYLAQEKLYISEKTKSNELIVAPENHHSLLKREVHITNLHLINKKDRVKSNLTARIRHLGQLNPGKLIKKSQKYYFLFNKPVKAPAAGQYLVLYDKDKVLGSAEIADK